MLTNEVNTRVPTVLTRYAEVDHRQRTRSRQASQSPYVVDDPHHPLYTRRYEPPVTHRYRTPTYVSIEYPGHLHDVRIILYIVATRVKPLHLADVYRD